MGGSEDGPASGARKIIDFTPAPRGWVVGLKDATKGGEFVEVLAGWITFERADRREIVAAIPGPNGRVVPVDEIFNIPILARLLGNRPDVDVRPV